MNKKGKNLTTKWTNIYVGLFVFFTLGFSFFLTSKIFIADEIDTLNTEIGKEFNLNVNGKYTIKDWVYDENSDMMQVTLITTNMRNFLSELNFKAVSRIDLEKELPTEVVYSSNDIYIVNIYEVPKDFKQVALRLVRKDISLSEEFQEETFDNNNNQQLITSIYADQRVVKRGNITEGDIKDYTIRVTKEMINETNKDIEELNNEVKKHNKFIEKINEKISNLEGELIYQSLEEQVNTNNEIYKLKSEIENANREIENLKLDIKAYEEKRERLEQRINELKF